METQRKFTYLLGDGDNIREQIEAFMLAGDLDSLGSLSRKLSEAIILISSELKQKMNAEIVVSAGDDILARVSPESYDRKKLEELTALYKQYTGSSISFGVGSTIESAYLNLRRAKSSRAAKIFETFAPEA